MLISAVFVLIFGGITPALAGPPAAAPEVPATCDGDFYNVMSNRAWMESEREMEVAQRLILKPDSVLEYSCFDQILEANAQNTNFAPTGSMIADLISAPLDTYLSNNFGNSVAGPSSASTCDVMFQVWDFMKCQNMGVDEFAMFAEFAAADGRALPEMCAAPNRDNNWETAQETVGAYEVDVVE